MLGHEISKLVCHSQICDKDAIARNELSSFGLTLGLIQPERTAPRQALFMLTELLVSLTTRYTGIFRF